MENVRPRGVPLSPGTALSKTDGDALTAEMASNYMSLVGSLLYLATCTRSDIAQSVGVLSKFMAGPTSAHWTAALGVLRYVSTTSGYGLTYGGDSISIVGYCDADYAGDIDTRRSTTGYLFMMGGGAISWSSKRQATVAASTVEAEYMAAAAAVKEGLWVRNLAMELGLGDATINIRGQPRRDQPR
jgi:hypothetical protein